MPAINGALVWHPSFYLDFSKDFIWLEGGDLNFFFKRTLPFKYFSHDKSFIWIHPRLSFGKSNVCSKQLLTNLEDEIFLKGGSVVTPQNFIWIFQKIYLTWGRWFKKFLQKNPPFQNIFFGKSFIWIHPRLVFGLGGSCFLFWTQAKIVFTWEKCLLKISLKILYSFWNNPLPLSTNLSCHDLSANPLS